MDRAQTNARSIEAVGRGRRKVLFVAEDVTLAHLGRMLALAGSLDTALYDVAIACGDRYAHFVGRSGLRHVHLDTMDPEYFAERLVRGAVLHTDQILRDAVRDDLHLLYAETPHLVVGDFRVSLGISAELVGVPYMAVSNGYWCPESTLPMPLPDHPMNRVFGIKLATRLANLMVIPLTLRAYAAPFNRMRKAVGLAPVESLPDVYTYSTAGTLYADIPQLAPTRSLPAGHQFIGPVSWEPPVELPEWWDQLPTDRLVVYLTVGTSGSPAIRKHALAALGQLPVTVMMASAGHDLEEELPGNFWVAPFLPGSEAANRADLVVCNGGSGSIYQALSAGVPFVGIASNADQHLASMRAVDLGAGELLRAGQLTTEQIAKSVSRLLGSENAREVSRQLGHEVRAAVRSPRFREAVDSIFRSSRHIDQAA